MQEIPTRQVRRVGILLGESRVATLLTFSLANYDIASMALRTMVRTGYASQLKFSTLWIIFAYLSPILPAMGSRNDHRVYMSFQDRHGWQCQFLEADLKTPLPRKLQFSSADKIVELVERGGGFKDQESRLMLDQGIAIGRGGVFLNLSDGQYATLKC